MTHLLATAGTLPFGPSERPRPTASLTSRGDWARLTEEAPIRASEEQLEAFAALDPAAFLGLLVSGRLDPADLTFAAEIAGAIETTIEVVPFLLKLLEHDDAVVREGAVYGLLPHLERSRQAKAALRRHLQSEESPGVRAAVAEALQQVEGE
jgi:HEAT repeat protein